MGGPVGRSGLAALTSHPASGVPIGVVYRRRPEPASRPLGTRISRAGVRGARRRGGAGAVCRRTRGARRSVDHDGPHGLAFRRGGRANAPRARVRAGYCRGPSTTSATCRGSRATSCSSACRCSTSSRSCRCDRRRAAGDRGARPDAAHHDADRGPPVSHRCRPPRADPRQPARQCFEVHADGGTSRWPWWADPPRDADARLAYPGVERRARRGCGVHRLVAASDLRPPAAASPRVETSSAPPRRSRETRG